MSVVDVATEVVEGESTTHLVSLPWCFLPGQRMKWLTEISSEPAEFRIAMALVSEKVKKLKRVEAMVPEDDCSMEKTNVYEALYTPISPGRQTRRRREPCQNMKERREKAL